MSGPRDQSTPTQGAQPQNRMTEEGFQTMLAAVEQQEQTARGQTPNFGRWNTADFAHIHGRLTQQITQKDATIRELRAEKGALERANHAGQRENDQLKTRLSRVETEKAALLQDMERVTRQVDEQKLAMKKLEEQTAKQKVTIKVQSDQIAQRALGSKSSTTPHRPSATKSTTTPHQAGPPPASSRDTYSQPPPTFNPQTSHATPLQRSDQPPPPPPSAMVRQQSNPVPPPSSIQAGPSRNTQIIQHPSSQPRESRGLVQIPGVESTIELANEFTRIFNLSETWARNYANVPDTRKDENLPSELQNSVDSFTNRESAADLLSSGSTRFFAVAKLMNYQISTTALRPVIAKGFHPYYDKKIPEYRTQLNGILAIHVRRALVTAYATTSLDMTKEPGFQMHIDDYATRQVHHMWGFLEPLFAQGISRNEAWKDLGFLWKEAARVGVLMMLKPTMFTLEYPPIGPSSMFNPAQMVNRDRTFKQYPQTLSQMGFSIRLSVTPVVTETDIIALNTTPKILHLANVLLEK